MRAAPAMICPGQIGETRVAAARIHAERWNHGNSICGTAQVAGIRQYRESRCHIRSAGRLQKDRGRRGAGATLQRKIDLDRAGVVEAAYATKSAKVMVERAVFLHQ